ncbi:MAG: metal-dependent hydrolase [Sulfitobacter sp.]
MDVEIGPASHNNPAFDTRPPIAKYARMFIAHLPAGYLASDLLAPMEGNRRHLILAGTLASGLPDLDLLWFYFVDNRQTAHHEYIFHWPLFWIALAGAAWMISSIIGRETWRPYILVTLACLLLHMVLDSFAAEIYWLQPFSDVHLNAVAVPARHNWWVWNFVLHWTFAAEIAICLAASILFFHRKRRKNTSG